MCVVGLLLYMLVSFGAARWRLNALEAQERTLTQHCAALREENARLRAVRSAAPDDGALESLARERLGLVRPDETVYLFH